MLSSALDHLVVTAPSLESGRARVAAAFGVKLSPGGEHARMGTHNALLRLGATTYLEVIAPNPNAPAPGHPRWFDLDSLAPAAPSRLRAWVVRTSDLDSALAGATVDLGRVEAMSRDDLHWRITIPPDGLPRLGGAAPCLIQWSGDSHPAAGLSDDGCSLVELEIRHPDPDAVRRLLDSIGFEGPVSVAASPAGRPTSLRARIATPGGVRVVEKF